jgi:hypothetical protein
MDIATQQPTPATESSTISALGDRPSGMALVFPVCLPSKVSSRAGGRRRRRNASPVIETAQKMPTPT